MGLVWTGFNVHLIIQHAINTYVGEKFYGQQNDFDNKSSFILCYFGSTICI